MVKTLQIPISEIMSRDLLIVRPEDKLERVNEIFHANNIHHIPVVKKDGTLVGMVSKVDFLKVNHMLSLFNAEKYEAYNEKLYHHMQVKEIMTRQLAKLSPEDTLSIAAGIFLENLFHALPVVDDGVLVGLVTTHDVISYCCNEQYLLNE